MIYRLDIRERRAYYLDNVSCGMMPISLETAEYLYNLCRKLRPKCILDSGSGFSSFVFRKYKIMSARQDVRVITIDHSKKWLNKTRSFLRECGIVPEDCYNISTFNRYSDLFQFDLIFEDYFIDRRGQRFKYDIRALKNNGIFIIDDAHLTKTGAILGPYVRNHRTAVYNLKELKDKYGRYPAIIKRI